MSTPGRSARARCVMVLGTSSGAGKSWVATALCRHYANQGLKVAPFKAQNMSNNARVVAGAGPSPQPSAQGGEGARPALARPDGVLPPLPHAGEGWGEGVAFHAEGGLPPPPGHPKAAQAPSGGSAAGAAAKRGGQFLEIGSAQYFQALAARAAPDVRMNPLLLKPEADTRSQVVLLGRVDRELSALPWRGRSERVWPCIAAALDALMAENDVVVIEGAGSPAELNLMASDVVNLRVARHAGARCLLVADIDRGGALAHLYGTWALLLPEDRARIHGFVLNKFRGDPALLAPGPEQLRQLTGVPTLAVVPMRFGHGLPEEDGVFDERTRSHGAVHTRIAIVAYPRISNLDEFQPLQNVPGVRVSWARSPAELDGADWLILPGSKATAADLAWLRAQGLDAAIAAHAARGARVLGICGGLQMLGEALIDMHQIEPGGSGPGLGLLPLVTRFEPCKTVRRTNTCFGDAIGAWSALSGVSVSGYEIHSGQTVQHPALAAQGDVAREVLPGLAWQNAAGHVLGVYLHGLFEDAAVLRALFGADAPSLDTVFDALAADVARAFEPGALAALVAP